MAYYTQYLVHIFRMNGGAEDAENNKNGDIGLELRKFHLVKKGIRAFAVAETFNKFDKRSNACGRSHAARYDCRWSSFWDGNNRG